LAQFFNFVAMRRRRFLLPALGALLSFGPALVQVPDEGLMGQRLAGGVETWKWKPGSEEAVVRGGFQTLCKRGFIYLLNLRLRPGTGREGRSEFFKIGGTRDMQQRLPAYVTAQPFYPEVISEVPVPDWRASESRLLRAFPRGSDMDGGEEWRRLTDSELETALGLMQLEVANWTELDEEAVPVALAREALLLPSTLPAWETSLPAGSGTGEARTLHDIHRQAARATVEHFSQQDRPRAVVVMPEGTELPAVGVEVAKMLLELGAELRRVVVVVDGPTDLQRSGALWLEARRSQGLAVQEVAVTAGKNPGRYEFRDYDLPFCKAGSAQLSSFLKVPAGRCHVMICKRSELQFIRSAMKDLASSQPPIDLMIYEDALKTTATLATGELTRYILDDSFLPAKRLVFLTSLTSRAAADLCQGMIRSRRTCTNMATQPDIFGPVVFRFPRSAAVRLGFLRPLKILQQDMTTLNCGARASKKRRRAAAIFACMEKYSLKNVYAFYSRNAEAADVVSELHNMPPLRGHQLQAFRSEGCSPQQHRDIARLQERFNYTESFQSAEPTVVSCVYVILDNRTAPPADMIFMAMDAKCSHLRVAQALRLVGQPILGKDHGLVVIPRENTWSTNRTTVLVFATLVAEDPALVSSLRHFLLHSAARGQRPLPTAWPQDIRELFVEGTELTLEQLGQAIIVALSDPESVWHFHADLVRCFRLREGHTNVPEDHQEVGLPLGRWLHEQRGAAREGELPIRHLERLEELGVGVPDTKSTARRKDEEWDHRYGQLLAYRAREGDCDVESLLKWLRKQSAAHKKGKLTKAKRRLLEALGVDLSYDNRTLEQRWKDNFAGLRSFVKREGHADVPAKHVEGEVKLGSWLATQRQQHKEGNLSAQRTKKLESLGVNLAPRTAQWANYAEALRIFVDREGHADVPGDHVESDLALGNWLDCQRGIGLYGGLEAKQVRLLRRLGVEMDAEEARWMRSFRSLRSFADAYGHTPSRTDEEQGARSLGLWVYVQQTKAREGKLCRERRELLQGIGIEFTAKSAKRARVPKRCDG
ncbi:unnamed protein product, partial [Symbiodinium sp. KB8]